MRLRPRRSTARRRDRPSRRRSAPTPASTASMKASACATPRRRTGLRADQRTWIGERNRCKDDACLERAYLNRLGELDPLQPGATSVRYVELPAVKALVAVLPPAEDTTALPPVKDAKPLVVTGA